MFNSRFSIVLIWVAYIYIYLSHSIERCPLGHLPSVTCLLCCESCEVVTVTKWVMCAIRLLEQNSLSLMVRERYSNPNLIITISRLNMNSLKFGQGYNKFWNIFMSHLASLLIKNFKTVSHSNFFCIKLFHAKLCCMFEVQNNIYTSRK